MPDAALWTADAPPSPAVLHISHTSGERVPSQQDTGQQTSGYFSSSVDNCNVVNRLDGGDGGGNSSNSLHGHRNGTQPVRRDDDDRLRPPDIVTSLPTSLRLPRFPCVFHFWGLRRCDTGLLAQDFTRICANKQEYVSRIRVHHQCRAHGPCYLPFYYCTNCFDTSRQTPINHHLEDEKTRFNCPFRCVTEKCSNYDRHPPYHVDCTHGKENAQYSIWRKLFRLAYGLGPRDWAPDPRRKTQSPPSALPPNHPMAGLYNPSARIYRRLGPSNQLRAIQPRRTPIPQETVRDVQAQYMSPGDIASASTLSTAPVSMQSPGDMAPQMISPSDDRMFADQDYSESPLQVVGTSDPSRPHNMAILARILWPIVASENPTLLSIPPFTRNMLEAVRRQRDANNGLDFESQLILRYHVLITDPASRSLAAWGEIQSWTHQILQINVDFNQECPWPSFQQLQQAVSLQTVQAGPSRQPYLWQNSAQQFSELTNAVMPSSPFGTDDPPFTIMNNAHPDASPWFPDASNMMLPAHSGESREMYDLNFLAPGGLVSGPPPHQQPSAPQSDSYFAVNEDDSGADQSFCYFGRDSMSSFVLSRGVDRDGSRTGYSNSSGQNGS